MRILGNSLCSGVRWYPPFSFCKSGALGGSNQPVGQDDKRNPVRLGFRVETRHRVIRRTAVTHTYKKEKNMFEIHFFGDMFAAEDRHPPAKEARWALRITFFSTCIFPAVQRRILYIEMHVSLYICLLSSPPNAMHFCPPPLRAYCLATGGGAMWRALYERSYNLWKGHQPQNPSKAQTFVYWEEHAGETETQYSTWQFVSAVLIPSLLSSPSSPSLSVWHPARSVLSVWLKVRPPLLMTAISSLPLLRLRPPISLSASVSAFGSLRSRPTSQPPIFSSPLPFSFLFSPPARRRWLISVSQYLPLFSKVLWN